MLLWLGTALAGTFGDPIRPTHLVSVDAGLEAAAVAGRVPDCAGDRCIGWSAQRFEALRLGVKPSPAVGAFVEAALGRSTVAGAGFDSAVGMVGVGAHLSLPREGFRPAGALRAELIRGPLAADAVEDLLRSWRAEAALFAAFGQDQISVWVGPYGAVGSAAFFLEPEAMQLQLTPTIPVGLVVGAELFSESLATWRPRPGRLSAGAELRVGYGAGLGAWVGYAY